METHLKIDPPAGPIWWEGATADGDFYRFAKCQTWVKARATGIKDPKMVSDPDVIADLEKKYGDG